MSMTKSCVLLVGSSKHENLSILRALFFCQIEKYDKKQFFGGGSICDFTIT